MINTIKNMIAKQMNPEQIVMNMIGNSNPVINELIKKGKAGDTKAVEDFARNMFKEQGRDFDTEFAEFSKMFKQ